MFKKGKNCKGFSLLELIIVIAVIGIVAAISFNSLTNTRRQAAVTNTCNELASFYNKTRNYALVGKVIDTNVPGYFKMKISGDLPGDDSNTIARIWYDDSTSGSDGSVDVRYKVITSDLLRFRNGVTCGPASYTGNPSGNSTTYGNDEGYYFKVPYGDVGVIGAADANINCVYCLSSNCDSRVTRMVRITEYNGFKAECQ